MVGWFLKIIRNDQRQNVVSTSSIYKTQWEEKETSNFWPVINSMQWLILNSHQQDYEFKTAVDLFQQEINRRRWFPLVQDRVRNKEWVIRMRVLEWAQLMKNLTVVIWIKDFYFHKRKDSENKNFRTWRTWNVV